MIEQFNEFDKEELSRCTKNINENSQQNNEINQSGNDLKLTNADCKIHPNRERFIKKQFKMNSIARFNIKIYNSAK